MLRAGMTGRQFAPINATLAAQIPTKEFNLTGQMPAGVTFARASTGTYYDSAGVLRTASSGTARFDWGPNPGASSTVNLVPNSSASGAVIGTPGTMPTDWAIFAGDLSTAVVGLGTENGLPYVDVRFFGTTAGTSFDIEFGGASIAKPQVVGLYTISVYAKIVSGIVPLDDQFYIEANWFDSSNSSVDATFDQVIVTRTLTRLVGQVTPTTASVVSTVLALTWDLRAGPVDFVLRVAAPQLEKGGTVHDWVSTSGTPAGNAPPLGLLIEDTKTNVVPTSIPDNTAWLASQATATLNVIAAPDGTSTATVLVDNANNSAHQISTNGTFAFVSGTLYSFSIYAKAGTASGLQIWFPSAAFGAAFCNYDLSAGTVGTNSGATSTAIQNLGNGWYRCLISLAATGSSTVAAFTCGTNGSNSSAVRAVTYVGSGTGVYIWGAQAEASLFTTSYIPTTSGSVARAVDQLSQTGGLPWYNQPAGTFFAEGYSTHIAQSGTQQGLMISDDATANNTIALFNSAAANQVVVFGNSASVAQINSYEASKTWDPVNLNKMSVCYGTGNWRGKTSGNAGDSITGNVGGQPATQTRLFMGTSNSSNNSWKLNGQLRRIRYWNRQMTITEMTALCT